MTEAKSTLFRTVPKHRYLGFWTNDQFESGEVAHFLDLKKADIAKFSGVSSSSVRFDQKIPREVLDRLTEIANVCELVAQHFNGDVTKTALWFRTANPLLGNISPRDMIRFGRYDKLQRFILEALAENAAVPEQAASSMTFARGAPAAKAAHS